MPNADQRDSHGNYDYHYDPRTFMGRKRLAKRAAEEHRDRKAVQTAMQEPRWWLWRGISRYIQLMWFGRWFD
jgi:hypothetical protein